MTGPSIRLDDIRINTTALGRRVRSEMQSRRVEEYWVEIRSGLVIPNVHYNESYQEIWEELKQIEIARMNAAREAEKRRLKEDRVCWQKEGF